MHPQPMSKTRDCVLGRGSRGVWWLPLVAVVATAVAFYPFALIDVDPHHDGIMFKPAVDVLEGQVLFRDTFSQYGAGLPYLQAAILGLFGPTLLALRLATVVVYALAAGLLVDVWRRLVPSSLACVSLGLWLVLPGFFVQGFPFLPWSSAYALLFQRGNALLCGVACGLVFLCRQPVGVVTALAALCGLGFGA